MTERRFPLPIRFVIGVILIFGLALAAFYLVMNPAIKDMRSMAYLLSFTACASVILSYLAYRMRWMHQSPSVRWTIMGGYLLSLILIFINVWLTAVRMFASQHDLQLAAILLVYAAGIALAFGYFFSYALTDRLRLVDQAANSLAAGKFETRITVEGRDEIAMLSVTFNEMSKKLEEAARLQMEADKIRRDLFAWVSHDLQTPLASIRLILEALADGMVVDEITVKRYISNAQREIRALSHLIDDLLQLAQLEAGGLSLEVGEYSIRDLVSDTLESFHAMVVQSQIELRGEVEQGLDTVWMDASLIGRVLINLVGNSIRHTPPVGRIDVKVSSNEEGILIEVRDTGVGIPPEILPRVFEQFYRSDTSRNRNTGGAGLGLAIARGIVEAHGGRIWVESVPGVVTSFSFVIPQPKTSGSPKD